MNNLLDIVFIGGSQRTLKTFQALLDREDINILFFLIQKDYPNEPQVYQQLIDLASKKDIPFEVSPSAKSLTANLIERISEIECDVLLRGGNWRAVLPPKIWKNAKYGSIGLHGSALPEYRGWANINWYIINGEKEYGLQMYRFNDQIDDGDLIYRKDDGSPMRGWVEIDKGRQIKEILEDVDATHVTLMMELVDLLKDDGVIFVKQDERRESWTCHRGPRDGEINWNWGTKKIFNFIRAQTEPYPGAFTFYKNEKLTVWKASMIDHPPNYVGRIPGKVISIREDGTIWVLTEDGILQVELVDINQHQKIRPAVYIKSVRQTLGFDSYEAFLTLKKEIKEIKEIT